MVDYLSFFVNGQEIVEHHAEPEWTLLWYLRNKLRLTGSKLGCGDGGCGACTVLVSQCINRESDEIEHRTINACLAPLCSVDGCHVITIEGLGSINKSNLHPTQKRVAELYASQCGFCTPGMVMSLYGIVTSKENTLPTLEDIEEGFDGNLCRCTGYRPILDAGKTFAGDADQLPECSAMPPSGAIITSTTRDKCLQFSKDNAVPLDQVKFPEKLRNQTLQSLHIKGSSMDWYRPTSLSELVELRQMYPGDQSKLLFGNTRVQLQRKYENAYWPRLISITQIKELQQLQRNEHAFYLGAGVTFTRLKAKLMEWNDNPHGFCQALLDQMKYFASTQIRNVASLGGNIVSASPISDINPVLMSAGASLELHRSGRAEPRHIALKDFYLGDRQVSIEEAEVLVAIHVPIGDPSKKSFFRSYKQARRRDDSKGIVSAGFHVVLDQSDSTENPWKIHSVCFAFGGMRSKTIVATQTQEHLVGLPWSKETINQAYDSLLNEMPLDDASPGGQSEYRRTLVQSFLFKFYSYVCDALHQPSSDSSYLPYHRGISHAQQTVSERPSSQKIVGSSMPHRSAYSHATGEAVYLDDMPSLSNGLHAAFVLSTKAPARIKSINTEAASKVPGFVAFVDHHDVPGSNAINGSLTGEEVFVSSVAYCVGALIGLVVAESEQAAQKAANLVQIEYELLSPTILSIEDAIQHDSYFGGELLLQKGDIEHCLTTSEHTVEGEFYVGSQEHFYMETNACMVIPSNDDKEVTLYLPTQSPSTAQEITAFVLGRDVAQITCHTKRIGGAFGGKESRSIPPCLAVAVAAVKTNRPVRLRLERHIDIATTGHRHPFKVHYKVGFNEQGQFSGLDIRMWSNAGWSLDASEAVMQLAMLHLGNTYQFPHLRIRGYVCKTHLPSNTAFRGFGGPQAMIACENVVEHVAAFLKRDPLQIRQLNLFKEGDTTHYGQVLENWNVPRILDELIQSSDFHTRQKQVQEFNRNSKHRKRGISLVPAKFGIGFIVTFVNQAGALVHIYKDGSVVVSHGGVEMGQGLHTKMIAIAAEALGCDINRIRIKETATDKIHNTSPTGGSVSSDLNGMAVKDACEQLRQRLDTLKTTDNENISWEELVMKAYFARLDLCARGFYTTPNMFDFNFKENRATFNYFTQGAAVTEVELDALTGDWHLLRVDILMDVGTSLNPHIDVGQIEGGFMQGVGLYTMEELIWGDPNKVKWVNPGELYTAGPDTYKIPSFSDVPLDFRVSLLSNTSNPRAVYSSKGIGEPPILLSTSVFFALKQACMAYREQQGLTDYFTLHSPATVERLRMACADEFTRRVCSNEYNTFQPKGSY